MKIKRKHIFFLVLFGICLIAAWFVFEFFREWECCDYTKKIKKSNEIIKKIEKYKLSKGKLPDLLEDIGEEIKLEGPIFYKKIDSNKYEIMFGTTLGESCVYHSDTKTWTPY